MAKKLTITMNENLLERLDKYCDDNFLNRSAMISIAIKQYLDGSEALKSFSYITEQLKAMQEMKSKETEIEVVANEQNHNA